MRQLETVRDLSASFPGTKLPKGIHATADLQRVAGIGVLVIAVPSQAMRQMSEALALVVPPGRAIISAAKGIEQQTGAFMTEILADAMGNPAVWHPLRPVICGGYRPRASNGDLACHGRGTDAEALAHFLSSPGLRLYHTTDIRGVEIGGAAKNVLAIAAGIVAGLGLGDSARAAMITRGFAELQRYAQMFGARPETLMGLSGLGDLVLTASSPQSRNYALGFALGQGARPGDALGSGKLAEGAFTAGILAETAKARGIDMPIVFAVTAILAGRLSVEEAVRHLMTRPLKGE